MAGEADSVSSVSASAPIVVNPGELAFILGLKNIDKLQYRVDLISVSKIFTIL